MLFISLLIGPGVLVVGYRLWLILICTSEYFSLVPPPRFCTTYTFVYGILVSVTWPSIFLRRFPQTICGIEQNMAGQLGLFT